MSLTRRQKQILQFVRGFIQEHGYSPSLEEIGRSFQISSLNAVYKHLKALEERGYIRRLSNQARSIQLLDPDTPRYTLPVLGLVAAGEPIEAVLDREEIAVPETFLTRGTNYVLRVRGDSMIDEHIQDGDYVIVEQRDHARPGEMVVALVDGEYVTLKRYYREGGRIRLQPANPDLPPILVEEERLRIQGVVVGVMRKFV